MGNIEFNTQNVTRLLRIANSSSNWISNTQTPVQIVQAGYVRDLLVYLTGTVTVTTTALTIDSWGPWGLIQNYQINSNVQASIWNTSGIAAAWIRDLLMGLEGMGNTGDTNLVAEQGSAAVTSIYAAQLAAGSGATTLFYWLPLAQKVNTLDGYIGIWDLQDPSIQMTLLYTPNSPTAASPFNIVEGTANTGAGLFVQTANTATIATPNMLITRVMYDPPVDPRDDPDFGYVNSWYEETWQTGLAGSKALNWRALANSGYLCRLLFGVWDSGPAAGIPDTQGPGSNFINFTVGNNAPVYVETIQEFRERSSLEIGHQLVQGSFYLDFLGRDLTMQNIIDTFVAGNINLQMNLNSSLGATPNGKVVRQMIQALQQ